MGIRQYGPKALGEGKRKGKFFCPRKQKAFGVGLNKNYIKEL